MQRAANLQQIQTITPEPVMARLNTGRRHHNLNQATLHCINTCMQSATSSASASADLAMYEWQQVLAQSKLPQTYKPALKIAMEKWRSCHQSNANPQTQQRYVEHLRMFIQFAYTLEQSKQTVYILYLLLLHPAEDFNSQTTTAIKELKAHIHALYQKLENYPTYQSITTKLLLGEHPRKSCMSNPYCAGLAGVLLGSSITFLLGICSNFCQL